MSRVIFFILVFAVSLQSHAVLLDIGSGIFQGSFEHTSEQTNSKSQNAFGVFANLSNATNYVGVNIGWYMFSFSSKENFPSAIDHSLSSNDMGPALRWQIDKQKLYSLTLAYGIICRGGYNDGSTDEALTGESYLLKFAVEPMVTERVFVGVGLNYYVANYKTSVVNSLQSEVSYKNTIFYPSLSFSYRY